MFFLVTAAELAALGAAVILPLLWIRGPVAPKLPLLIRFHPSIALEAVKLERMPAPAPRSRPTYDGRLVAPIKTPTAIAHIDDIGDAPAPALSPFAAGPPGLDVPFVPTDVGKTLPPPAPPKEHPAPAPRPHTEPVVVSRGVQEAKLIHKVMPIYPPLAIRTRQFGRVELIGIVGKDGRMREIKVVSGPAFLVAAAVEAVKQWVYKPTLLSGEPVEVVAPITVNFTLAQ